VYRVTAVIVASYFVAVAVLVAACVRARRRSGRAQRIARALEAADGGR
jgi:Flp pilus assembly protein TadB